MGFESRVLIKRVLSKQKQAFFTMAGTARKSTHKKKSVGTKKSVSGKVTKEVSKRQVVDVDPEKKYGIEGIGPVHLTWVKRKMVTEFALAKPGKHLMWVKWDKPFEDKYESKDDFMTTWSAEPQAMLCEDGHNKKAVEEALRNKKVWPWVTPQDEGYEQRLAILKIGGYQEWRASGRPGKNSSWKVKFGLDPATETDKTDSSDESTSTDTAGDEDDEEDDEV